MSVKCQKNVGECFPNPKKKSSNVAFCSKPKYLKFTDIEEGRNRTTFTFKKLESENVAFSFALQKLLKWINRLSKQLAINWSG